MTQEERNRTVDRSKVLHVTPEEVEHRDSLLLHFVTLGRYPYTVFFIW